ncbi:gamma-glutamyltransferase 2. Threonine peptidase. MEROPS family T03 [Rhizobiales bacterium GAS191]|nr:gamma-glutamyltransferase 2. Threonine peptidase. MEROPS family T03 [Rhizobiales bacterium GAS191]
MGTLRDFTKPGRSVAIAEHGMAATSHPLATLAALDMLRTGGNAVDAAIAAVAVQAVVDPHMTGIGGDCFYLHAPRAGKPIAFNGSGRAPAGAELDWYLEKGFNAIPDLSPHCVTIPGAVDAWCRLSADHGTKSLDEVFAPAIRAAEEGFAITPRVAGDWSRFAGRVAAHEAAAKVYLPSGKAPSVGDKLRHPALGRMLRRIAREGRKAFYEGEVAEELAACLAGLGGFHTVADFAEHSANYVDPISATYRGHELFECPPNGQGLAALLIVRILEGFDLGSTALSEADRIHLHAEATKAAYRLRDHLVADPDHQPLDIDELLSDASIARLRAPITLDKAQEASVWDGPTHRDTIYLCVVDKDRNAISFINSLFSAFGSGIYAPNSGVLLQNRGTGFRVERGHRNAIAPRKRPLHTIIPGMLSRNGRAVMPFGVMGGQFQAAGHAHFLSQMLDRGDDPQQASDRPRSFSIDGVLSLETTIPESVFADLTRRGHRTAWAPDPLGGCQAILIDEARGVLMGGSDHRKDGMALGY